MSYVKSLVEYCVFRSFVFIFRCLPRRCALCLLKKTLYFSGYVCGIRKKVVLTQLKFCFPDKSTQEIETLAKNVYLELAVTVAEVFVFDERYFESRIETVGFENLKVALAQGNGVILASAHFGNWELGAKIVAKEAGQIYGVAKAQKNKLFDNYINKQRKISGVNIIEMKNALKHIVSALKKNQVVAVLIDQYAHRQGVEMDFFGHKTKTYTSVAQLAIKYKTPVVLAFDIRDESGRHKVIFHEPMMFDSLEFNEQNVLEATKMINQRLEEYITKYPHLWFWVHRKWRNVA